MISFNNLGYMGQLGNQMFQYAALRGIASHKGYWYSVPADNELHRCFNLPATLAPTKCNTTVESKFGFDKDIFDNCPDDVDVIGYFQTEKYFKHIEHLIRQDFTFHEYIVAQGNSYRDKNLPQLPLISMHIRRKDYLTNTGFAKLPVSYYETALRILPKSPVVIFSDDIDWCKKIFISDRFIFSDNSDYVDLYLMSLCSYHVIANSTFSWWGSWLAKSSQTIAPKTWFDGELLRLPTEDFYLSNWIVI